MQHFAFVSLPFNAAIVTSLRRGALSFDIPSLSINLADAFELFESSKQVNGVMMPLTFVHHHYFGQNTHQAPSHLTQRYSASAEQFVFVCNCFSESSHN